MVRRAGALEIEVTPEMIEAGAMVLLDCDRDRVSYQEQALAVWRAMVLEMEATPLRLTPTRQA